MGKTMLGLLLAAGAAMPAVAMAPGWAQDRPDAPHQDHGGRPHGDGHHGNGGNGNGGGRPAEAPRPAPAPAAPAVQAQVQAQAGGRYNGGARADAGGGFDAGRGGWNRPDGNRPQGGQPGAPGPYGYRPQGGPSGSPGSGGYRPQGGPPVAPGSGGYRPQGGYAPAYRGNPGYRPDGDRGGGNWSRTWRDDRHYDWRSYRIENRYVFNLPRYYAPSGWGYGYRRFAPGFTLSAVLFAQDYWINDPFYYRLPPAYGPYRWVRYYNDALLIDLRSGYVVDTVYDIFW